MELDRLTICVHAYLERVSATAGEALGETETRDGLGTLSDFVLDPFNFATPLGP